MVAETRLTCASRIWPWISWAGWYPRAGLPASATVRLAPGGGCCQRLAVPNTCRSFAPVIRAGRRASGARRLGTSFSGPADSWPCRPSRQPTGSTLANSRGGWRPSARPEPSAGTLCRCCRRVGASAPRLTPPPERYDYALIKDDHECQPDEPWGNRGRSKRSQRSRNLQPEPSSGSCRSPRSSSARPRV